MKLKINYKKNSGKFSSMWRLNNILLNNQWVKEEIKGNKKKKLETNENGNVTYQIHAWYVAKAFLRGKFSDRDLPQETSLKLPKFIT